MSLSYISELGECIEDRYIRTLQYYESCRLTPLFSFFDRVHSYSCSSHDDCTIKFGSKTVSGGKTLHGLKFGDRQSVALKSSVLTGRKFGFKLDGGN